MAKKECDCIFCNLKCPECGAEEIEMTYSPVFTCHNDMKDNIIFDRDADRIELNCDECGAWLTYEDDSEKLEHLRKVLDEKLQISHSIHFTYDEKHSEITGTQFRFKRERIDQA